MASIKHLPAIGDGGTLFVPGPPPVLASTQASFQLNDQVTLHCAAGYTRPHTFVSKVIQTPAGTLAWEPPTLECKPVVCNTPPLPPNYGAFSQAQFHFPLSFHYICDEGYRLNNDEWTDGRNMFWCGTLGQWSPTPPPPEHTIRCDPASGWCPDPPELEDGSLARTLHRLPGASGPGTFLDDVVLYRCDPDFYALGGETGGNLVRHPEEERTRTCQRDGSWSGEAVMCTRLPCPPLNPGTAIFAEAGSLSVVDCGGGKTVTMKCLPFGRWSLKAPYCDGVAETDRTPNFPVVFNPPVLLKPSPTPPAPPKPPAPPVPPVAVHPSIVRGTNRQFVFTLLSVFALFAFVTCFWWLFLRDRA